MRRHHPKFISKSSSRASQVRKFPGKRTYKPKKEFAYIECAQGHQPVRCPNRIVCVRQPSAVPSGGGVLVVSSCVSVARRW